MKRILIIVLTLSSLYVFPQSPEIRAKSAFLKAQELYSNEDYTGAINLLKNVKQLLGSSNPRVDYLLTECYIQSEDGFGAQESVKSYFELAEESDANYNTMLLNLQKIEPLMEASERRKKEMERVAVYRQKDNSAWKSAVESNDLDSFERYIRNFRNGEHLKDAYNALLKTSTDLLVDTRDGQTYKTVRIGLKTWMAENLNYDSKESECYDGKEGNCEQYGRLYSFSSYQNVCPNGWSLPTYEDMLKLVRAEGIKLTWTKYKSESGKQVESINFHKSNAWTSTRPRSPNGFDATPSGWARIQQGKRKPAFGQIGAYSSFWLADGAIDVAPDAIYLYQTKIYSLSPFYLSCRCIKD